MQFAREHILTRDSPARFVHCPRWQGCSLVKGRWVARMWVAMNQMQIDSWDTVIFLFKGAPCEVIAEEVDFGGLLASGFVEYLLTVLTYIP